MKLKEPFCIIYLTAVTDANICDNTSQNVNIKTEIRTSTAIKVPKTLKYVKFMMKTEVMSNALTKCSHSINLVTVMDRKLMPCKNHTVYHRQICATKYTECFSITFYEKFLSKLS